MNKIYESVEDPVTKTKRIKCDLCDNTYSHHPALRYHRLREHGKYPIPRKPPQRRKHSLNSSNNSKISKHVDEHLEESLNEMLEEEKQHIFKEEFLDGDHVSTENDFFENQSKKTEIDSDDDDQHSNTDIYDNLYKNPDNSRCKKPRPKRYETVIDPVTNKKRIKCDLCENTYAHHPALRNHRFRAHGKFPVPRKSRKTMVSRKSSTDESMNNEQDVDETFNELDDFHNEQLNSENEIQQLEDDNIEECIIEEEIFPSENIPIVNETIIDEFQEKRPKIEYMELPNNVNTVEEYETQSNIEENVDSSTMQADDKSGLTCGFIKASMDYSIFNINCFYCDEVFSLVNHEEFILHLKMMHPHEEEVFEEEEEIIDNLKESNNEENELEAPVTNLDIKAASKEFSLKIEIDHDAINEQEDWLEPHSTTPDAGKQSHNVSIPVLCSICEKSFRNEFRLKFHMRLRHNIGRKPDRRKEKRHCDVCNITFRHPSYYRKHILVHKPPSYKCEICDKQYRWRHSFNDHLKLHANKRDHVCELCGASFFCYSRLRQHTKLKHADESSYPCKICDYTCKTSMLLWVHRRKHHLVLVDTIEEPNKILDDQIPIEYNEDDREEVAKFMSAEKSNNKSFNSDEDNEATQQRKRIKKSLTVLCDLCNKYFRDQDNLQNHQYRVHKFKRHGVEDRHCNICDRTFKLPSMYRSHIAVHKPPSFKCQTCGKEFRWRKSLSDHLKIHANQRDHVCELCGASFFHYVRLRDHMKMWHFDERNYACNSCDSTFKTSTQLCQHRKRFHANLDGSFEESNNKESKKYPSQRKPKGRRATKYQYVVDPVTNVKRLKCDLCDNTYSHHPALRYHRFNEHGKLPIQKKRQRAPKKDQNDESSFEEDLNCDSNGEIVITEDGEIINCTDDLIVYDVTEDGVVELNTDIVKI